jgi:alkanesulfonate monooxygenase SsuD/methylene tetrahydromethanopterin reductase-like flavin-dependent oxidoreductase (luciferase family)
VPIYVGDTVAAARADPEDSILQFYRTLGLQLERSAALAGTRTSERREERGQALQTISYPDVLRDKVIVGTPDAVVKRLAELSHTLGLSGVLAEINCGGRISTDKVMRSLQLMSEQVVPHFR